MTILIQVSQVTSRTIKFTLLTKPQAASRPRVTRYGAYHTKNYTEFKNQAHLELLKLKKLPRESKDLFHVTLDIICKRPRSPSREYPQGDVDNYVKSYLDAITKANILWEDDVQVVGLVANKRYQVKGEDYGCHITIRKVKPPA